MFNYSVKIAKSHETIYVKAVFHFAK